MTLRLMAAPECCRQRVAGGAVPAAALLLPLFPSVWGETRSRSTVDNRPVKEAASPRFNSTIGRVLLGHRAARPTHIFAADRCCGALLTSEGCRQAIPGIHPAITFLSAEVPFSPAALPDRGRSGPRYQPVRCRRCHLRRRIRRTSGRSIGSTPPLPLNFLSIPKR